MAVIGLVGPHAIGKTTAVRRWTSQYSGLLGGVLCDNGLLLPGDVKEKGWNGNAAEKRHLVEGHRNSGRIVVLEGCSQRSTAWVSCFGLEDHIIHVYCPSDWFEQIMRHRCESKSKTYRKEYWTKSKLLYECKQRFANYADKNLRTSQVTHFQLASYNEWPAVDSHFRKLFIRTHNQLSRGKQ